MSEPSTTDRTTPEGRPRPSPERSPSAPPTHGRTLARGSLYAGLSAALAGAAGLATSITAARVVAPSDFGLMGVALLTVGVMQALSQTGFERALVQRQNVDGYLDAAWTFQVARGVLLMLLGLGLSAPLAGFFGEDAVAPVIAAMSLSFLVQGFRSASTVLMTRALDFRALFVRDAARAVLTLGISLAAVLTLRNVWALVVASLAGAVMDLVVGYVSHPYRPRFELDRAKLRELTRFGKWITAMSILALAVTKLDDLVVGKYLGVAALGLYAMAFEIANLPATHVTYVLSRVSFPTYARLRDGGEAAPVRAAFRDVMRATVLVSGSVSVALYFAIPGIVEHVIGARWAPIVPLVRILVVAGFVRSFLALGGALFQGVGRPDLDFRMNLPRLGLLLLAIYPACRVHGIEGAAWVALASVLACVPGWLVGLKGILGLTALDVVSENRLALAAMAVLALTMTAAVEDGAPPGMWAARLGAGVSAWLVIMWGLERWTSLRLFDEVGSLLAALREIGAPAKPARRG